MTTSETKKLKKALKLAIEVESLINSVKKSNESFRYSSNINSLENRISGTISILKGESAIC